MTECIICDEQAKLLPNIHIDGDRFKCPRCGAFEISGSLVAVLRQKGTEYTADQVAKLSSWVRYQNMRGEIPCKMLTVADYDYITAMPIPEISDRINRLLAFVAGCQPSLGQTFNMKDPALIAVSYSKNGVEVDRLLHSLIESCLIAKTDREDHAEITPAGYMRCEELHAR